MVEVKLVAVVVVLDLQKIMVLLDNGGNCTWDSRISGDRDCAGGGGGYYGGASYTTDGYGCGAGGSGYVNTARLTSASTSTSSHTGNGQAKITPVT